jgi:hypothetical protein
LTPFLLGNSNFLLVKNEQPQVQADFLQVLSQDWAPTDRTGSNVVAGFRQTFWQDTGVGVAVTDEDVSSVIYFKPTGFVDHLDAGVTDGGTTIAPRRAFDHGQGPGTTRARTRPSTTSTSQAVYTLDLDPSLGLRFGIDGNPAARRYQPSSDPAVAFVR